MNAPAPRLLVALAALLGAGKATAASEGIQQPGPITVVEQKGPSKEEFPLKVTTDDGVWLGFKTIWVPERPETRTGMVAAAGATIDRVITDVGNGLYFGYRMTTKLAPGDRVRIEFGPLPPDFPLGNHLGEDCERCPPFTPLSAALVRYPAAQTVEDGGAFTLELLRNSKTGESLSDFVRVRLPKPEERLPESVTRVATKSAPGDRFRVDLVLRWDASGPEVLVADVHVVDLRTLKEMNATRLPLAHPEDKGLLRFGGRTEADVPFDALVQVQASRSLGTVVYTIEVREGEDLVHAERVSLPYPRR